jgi:hypothetical protein
MPLIPSTSTYRTALTLTGNHIMGLSEKFVPCKRNDPSQTENIQKCNEKHGNAAPDNIGLIDEILNVVGWGW